MNSELCQHSPAVIKTEFLENSLDQLLSCDELSIEPNKSTYAFDVKREDGGPDQRLPQD